MVLEVLRVISLFLSKAVCWSTGTTIYVCVSQKYPAANTAVEENKEMISI
jgi:hypothetical protein